MACQVDHVIGDSLGVIDVLLGQFGPVKPVTPAQVLADEGDGHGCLIGIQLGHVQVINKVDELLGAWWSVVNSSLHIFSTKAKSRDGSDVDDDVIIDKFGWCQLLI